jgi:hypothetical protein
MLGFKLLMIMNFFLKDEKLMKKYFFPQIPTTLMAMLEGASFSALIGYKTHFKKKK